MSCNSEDEIPICIGCGLCCDGTLHAHTNVRSEDRSATAAVGLQLVQGGTTLMFEQPCPKLRAGRCTAYSIRPPVCRRYSCALLERVRAGLIPASEARQTISVAKRLVKSLSRHSPDAVLASRRHAIWQELENSHGQRSTVERKRSGRTILAIAALDRHLQLWFVKHRPSANAQAE
jgi:uncharacterized protein